MPSQSDSQVYAPDYVVSGEEEPLCQYRKRIEKGVENSVEGKWTQEQNIKYALFMDFHFKTFLSKQKRKSTRIFKTLSSFLSSRTPRQCRSHFQKIIGKFKTVKKVKQHYQETLGLIKYQNMFDSISRQLQTTVLKIQDRDSSSPSIVKTCQTYVQTDPIKVTLADLPSSEILKLSLTLNGFHNPHLPIWMPGSHYIPAKHHSYGLDNTF